MIKRTTPELAEFIAELLGTPKSAEKSRSRRLREADLLSQYGQGRGAAAATSKDAALLLLVSATGVAPLYAVPMAMAIANCRLSPPTDDDGTEGYANPYMPRSPAKTAVDELAAIIGSEEWRQRPSVEIIMRNSLAISISDGVEYVGYRIDEADSDPAYRRLVNLFGEGSQALRRIYRVEGSAIRELGNWLRGNDQPASEIEVKETVEADGGEEPSAA